MLTKSELLATSGSCMRTAKSNSNHLYPTEENLKNANCSINNCLRFICPVRFDKIHTTYVFLSRYYLYGILCHKIFNFVKIIVFLQKSIPFLEIYSPKDISFLERKIQNWLIFRKNVPLSFFIIYNRVF